LIFVLKILARIKYVYCLMPHLAMEFLKTLKKGEIYLKNT